jgi:VWFA-related protein
LCASRRLLCFATLMASCVAVMTREPMAAREQAAPILVNVAVTRAGAPVDGLAAADFVIRDSGVAQSAALVPPGTVPVSLLLAFDTSASVRGSALEDLKAAAHAAVAALGPRDEAALLTFSQNVTLRAGWTSTRVALEQAIDGLTGQGLTALSDGVLAALAMGGKPDTRRLVLFFTDGDDTSSWTSPPAIVQAARRSGAVIAAVTLDTPGHSTAEITKLLEARKPGDKFPGDVMSWMTLQPSLYRGALLPLLAIDTGGDMVRAADTVRLRTALPALVTAFSRRYVLRYTPTGVAATGWHPLQIEVTNGGDVSARSGYWR